MNKRQKKKNRTYKRKKVRAIINIDLTNVTADSTIDVYVSKRFKATNDKEQTFGKDGEISVTKALAATGKEYIAHVCNGKNKSIYFRNMRLSKTDKTYYVIYSGDKS